MKPVIILNSKSFDLTIKRLCFQLIENHDDFSDSVIIGLQPRGVYLANRIKKELEGIIPNIQIPLGKLDVTFFRDDFRRRSEVLIPNATQIDFIIEAKRVILIDDVLYTGRTIRSGMDAMLAFGRPKKVELLVLIDRRFSRDLPVQANYVGATIDSIVSDKVKVEWKEIEGEDQVILFNSNSAKK